MRSGLRPIHSVETITCTSEMSGTASSGVRVIAQIPHAVRTMVPTNTRNRFAAHQSRSLFSTWTSRLSCDERRLERAEPLAVARDRDGRFPAAGHHDFAGAAV